MSTTDTPPRQSTTTPRRSPEFSDHWLSTPVGRQVAVVLEDDTRGGS